MNTEIALNPNISVPLVAFVGITTVFVALTVLVGVLIGIRRVLDMMDPENAVYAPRVATATPTMSSSPSPAAPVENLALVAAAAYAFHLGRRITTVRGPQAQTRWSAVGRQTQVMRFERRR